MSLARVVGSCGLLACGASTAATSPALPPSPVATPDLLVTITGFIAVMVVMAGCVWLLKRMGMVKTGAGSIGKIVGGVSVGNRERVVVVEIGDQWIVVGVAPGRVNALAQLPRQESMQANEAPASPNFAHWLKRAYDQRSGNTGR